MSAGTPRRKILIVEDEPSVRHVLNILVKGLSCESDAASNAQQALAILRHTDFDAVLLDLRCPDLAADQVVPQIHEIRPHLVGRVLVITGAFTDSKVGDHWSFYGQQSHGERRASPGPSHPRLRAAGTSKDRAGRPLLHQPVPQPRTLNVHSVILGAACNPSS